MPEIETVGVLGAGTMGHGIAQVAAQAGYRTFLYDVSLELAERGVRRVGENLQRGMERGKVTSEQKEATLRHLSAVCHLADVARCGLVIEAIPEDIELKKKMFRLLSGCDPRLEHQLALDHRDRQRRFQAGARGGDALLQSGSQHAAA